MKTRLFSSIVLVGATMTGGAVATVAAAGVAMTLSACSAWPTIRSPDSQPPRPDAGRPDYAWRTIFDAWRMIFDGQQPDAGRPDYAWRTIYDAAQPDAGRRDK